MNDIFMKRQLLLFVAILCSFYAYAQKNDSLFVKLEDKGWSFPYKRVRGETIFSIAHKFHVPPAIMADYNQINFQQDVNTILKLQVPVAAYNFTKIKEGEVKPLYFRANSETSLRQIAKTSQVSQKTLQEWNNTYTNELKNGQVLLVGWVMYDATNLTQEKRVEPPVVITNNTKTTKDTAHKSLTNSKPINGNQVIAHPIEIPLKDTSNNVLLKEPIAAAPIDSTLNIEGEKLFLEQNVSEEFAAIERGSSVFFKRAGKTGNGIFYAFHNVAKKGTIIKVTNVGNERVIYARVIGPLPKTNQYYNSIIGISSDARAALDARDEKAWVEIKYSPSK